MVRNRTEKMAGYLLLSVFLFLIGSSSFGAEYANSQLLISPPDIEQHAGKWIVLDCRDVKAVSEKKQVKL